MLRKIFAGVGTKIKFVNTARFLLKVQAWGGGGVTRSPVKTNTKNTIISACMFRLDACYDGENVCMFRLSVFPTACCGEGSSQPKRFELGIVLAIFFRGVSGPQWIFH